MNYRSLAFRLGALYTLLLSATFALVGAGTFYGLQQYLRSNLRDSLSRRSMQVEQILTQAPRGVSNMAIAQEIEINGFALVEGHSIAPPPILRKSTP